MEIDPQDVIETAHGAVRAAGQAAGYDAAIAIVIAVLAVTALTQLWPLYWAALVPTAFGAVMGVAGLAGWHIHPDMLVKLLT